MKNFHFGSHLAILRYLSALLALAPALVACGASDEDSTGHAGEYEHAYATSAIVFGEDAETAYVSVLPNLEVDRVELDNAIEYPGWASVSAAEGKL